MERACCNRTVWSTIERVCGGAAIATAFRARSRWQIMTHLLQVRCQGNCWTRNHGRMCCSNKVETIGISISHMRLTISFAVHCARWNFLKLRMIYGCAGWHCRHYRFWFIPFRWILVQNHLSSKSSPVCEWLMISAILRWGFLLNFYSVQRVCGELRFTKNNNKSKTCKEPSLLYSRVPQKNSQYQIAHSIHHVLSLSYFHELQNGSPYGTWIAYTASK